MKSMCLDSIKVAAGVDKEKEQAERLALLNNNVKALRALQERLVEGICSPSSSECKGKTKDDSLVISALKTRVEAGVNACSEAVVPKELEGVADIIKAKAVPVIIQKKAELAGEKVADKPAEKSVPISDLPGQDLPQSSVDAVSFFKGLFHKLTFGFFA
jgi:hypothetical protein